MIQEMLGLLPDRVQQLPLGILIGIGTVGVILAIAGGRYSRTILTLALVALGTVIGLRMPRWFAWGVDPMGTAFGAAIVLGLSGYFLTRTWEGLLLGLLLAGAAGVMVWATLAPGVRWQLPQVDASAIAVDMVVKVWKSLPVILNRSLPAAVGIGLATGALLPSLWPRIGRVAFHSVAGLSLVLLAAGVAVQRYWPAWLDQLPGDPVTQGAIFALLVALMAGVQWMLLPAAREAQDDELSDQDFVEKQVKTAKSRLPGKMPGLVAASVARPRMKSH